MSYKLFIKDFSFYYGSFKALDNINIKIKDKTVTSLIGPSGCGKSTLLRSLNRMNDLIDNTRYKGEINLDDKNILDPHYNVVDLRKSVGMVFQKPNPFYKSIYDNIVYAPKIHGMRSKESLDNLVYETLNAVGLWKEVKHKLTNSALELSGGQQQRLCIARTIAMQPDVILMDEPTSALDPISTVKIEELITKLKEKYTIVIVTHSMQQAARISDNTGFFLMGKLIEFDQTKIIFSIPKNKKTEDYITGKFG